MSKTGRGRAKRPLVWRSGIVLEWGGHLFVRAERGRDGDNRQTFASLDLCGKLSEAVRGVDSFVLTLHPSNDLDTSAADIACVGSFIAMKPELRGMITLAVDEFNFALALVLAGKLRTVDLSFQVPRYRSSLIASISFRTSAIDDE